MQVGSIALDYITDYSSIYEVNASYSDPTDTGDKIELSQDAIDTLDAAGLDVINVSEIINPDEDKIEAAMAQFLDVDTPAWGASFNFTSMDQATFVQLSDESFEVHAQYSGTYVSSGDSWTTSRVFYGTYDSSTDSYTITSRSQESADYSKRVELVVVSTGETGTEVTTDDGQILGSNLLSNGDFETGGTTTSTNGNISGWTDTYGVDKQYASSFGLSNSGHNQVFELDVSENTRIYQQASGLTAGQKLRITFDTAVRQNGQPASEGVRVYWNGEVIAELTGLDDWETRKFDVMAGTGNGTDTLTFEAMGASDGNGAVIDNVMLQAHEDGSGNPVMGTLPTVVAPTPPAPPTPPPGSNFVIKPVAFEEPHEKRIGRVRVRNRNSRFSHIADFRKKQQLKGPNVGGRPVGQTMLAPQQMRMIGYGQLRASSVPSAFNAIG